MLITLSFILLLSDFPRQVFAESKNPPPCFDFTQKTQKLLNPEPLKYEEGKDPSEKGQTAGIDWARISGVINQPIADLYKKIQDPKTIRSGDNVKVELKELGNKDYLKLYEQSISLKPVFFLKLFWKENWAFELKEGTAAAPHSILVSYQKFVGTTYIDRFCGNILLKKISPTKTSIFIYQEMKADKRDAQNVLDDITGTVRTLRQ